MRISMKRLTAAAVACWTVLLLAGPRITSGQVGGLNTSQMLYAKKSEPAYAW
jgi:hypothetical protein